MPGKRSTKGTILILHKQTHTFTQVWATSNRAVVRRVVWIHMASNIESVTVPFSLVGDDLRKEIVKTVVLHYVRMHILEAK